MKRISWSLTSYDIPDFKIYDKASKRKSGQVPLSAESRPPNNTYFIGNIKDAVGAITEKLLCFHTMNGEYVVISYNFSSAKLLQNVLDTELYETRIATYNGTTMVNNNASGIPTINRDLTIT